MKTNRSILIYSLLIIQFLVVNNLVSQESNKITLHVNKRGENFPSSKNIFDLFLVGKKTGYNYIIKIFQPATDFITTSTMVEEHKIKENISLYRGTDSYFIKKTENNSTQYYEEMNIKETKQFNNNIYQIKAGRPFRNKTKYLAIVIGEKGSEKEYSNIQELSYDIKINVLLFSILNEMGVFEKLGGVIGCAMIIIMLIIFYYVIFTCLDLITIFASFKFRFIFIIFLSCIIFGILFFITNINIYKFLLCFALLLLIVYMFFRKRIHLFLENNKPKCLKQTVTIMTIEVSKKNILELSRTILPMLGFLGTVIGLIQYNIQQDTQTVSLGLALITTFFGLFLSIIIYLFSLIIDSAKES
jgi:hypothetical protein